MKRSRPTSAVLSALAAAVLPLGAQEDFCASPIGVSHLVSGVASCEVVGGTTFVEVADNSVLHWDSFNLQANHELEFNFADSRQTVVNRALGPSPTFIGGRLTSNGKVVVLSPDSWLEFREGASVRAASFTASGLQADNAQFFGPSRTREFQATARSNPTTRIQGTITTTEGDVLLVGRELRITAAIDAAGAITAVSGERVTVEPGKPEATVTVGGRQVTQTGVIRAGRDIEIVSQLKVGLAGELSPGQGRGRVFVRVAENGRILADPSVTVRGRTEFSVPIEGSIAIIDPDEGDNPGARSPAVNELPLLGKRKRDQRARPSSSTIASRAGTGFTKAEEGKRRKKTTLANLGKGYGKGSFYGMRGAAVKRGRGN